jgi:hypothetical protein
VSTAAGVGDPSFDHELDYVQIAFPDSGSQLPALFRWWNILQYWAPDRDVAGQDWAAVLAEFIPKMALAKDETDYQLAPVTSSDNPRPWPQTLHLGVGGVKYIPL